MDYSIQCWACGKVPMVDRGAYYQCSECGATWNNVPQLGPPTTILEHDETRARIKDLHNWSYSPTPGVTRKARKAREAKEVKTQ